MKTTIESTIFISGKPQIFHQFKMKTKNKLFSSEKLKLSADEIWRSCRKKMKVSPERPKKKSARFAPREVGATSNIPGPIKNSWTKWSTGRDTETKPQKPDFSSKNGMWRHPYLKVDKQKKLHCFTLTTESNHNFVDKYTKLKFLFTNSVFAWEEAVISTLRCCLSPGHVRRGLFAT